MKTGLDELAVIIMGTNNELIHKKLNIYGSVFKMHYDPKLSEIEKYRHTYDHKKFFKDITLLDFEKYLPREITKIESEIKNLENSIQ